MNNAGEPLVSFKDAWLQLIKDSSEWDANQPQSGFGPKTPEFIYRPSGNQFGLDVWRHPEYLSARDRGGIKPGHLSAMDESHQLPVHGSGDLALRLAGLELVTIPGAEPFLRRPGQRAIHNTLKQAA